MTAVASYEAGLRGEQETPRVIGFTELKERYLSHGYPLLMLDRVLDYRPGQYVHAIKCVTGNAPDVVGHFPKKRAMMAGTNVIQAFSQLAIVFFKLSNGLLEDDEMTLVTSVSARFSHPVYPGDTLHLHLVPRKLDRSVDSRPTRKVDGKSVTGGRLTLAKLKTAQGLSAVVDGHRECHCRHDAGVCR